MAGKGLSYWKGVVEAAFPGDAVRVKTFFAAALNSEDLGNSEKADHYLDKAIVAEEKAIAEAEAA